MPNTDNPYDDPYYGYYDPYYGFYGEPRYAERDRTYNPNNENWQPGPYTGVGPRNYLRSDARIQDDLNDRLWLDGNLDARDIDVTVSNGVVTLSGYVESREAKRRAQDIAWGVPGVWDVNNQLKVNRQIGPWRAKMTAGMQVVGSGDKPVGTVLEVRDLNFRVDRESGPDLYIPFTAVQDVHDNTVRINIPVTEVDYMSWPTLAR